MWMMAGAVQHLSRHQPLRPLVEDRHMLDRTVYQIADHRLHLDAVDTRSRGIRSPTTLFVSIASHLPRKHSDAPSKDIAARHPAFNAMGAYMWPMSR